MSAHALPEIIAHRGNAAEYPENTLQALASAVELGVRHLEFDVQLTSDNVPVVFHDSTLERVADRPDSVHDLTWAQLAEIPVGEVKRFGSRFAFTYPPSLAQTVDAIAGWEGVTAFVEVKRASLRKLGRETVLRRTAEIVRPILDRCVFISFDLPSVKILRMMTGARVGWVLQELSEAELQHARAVAPDFLFCDLDRIREQTTQLWHGPWQWAVYEVRDIQTAQRCQALGAAFVETMAVKELLAAYDASRRQW
jgi:glycerophosphoryl diester phosphodiesterase